jgi:hypothetical protein
MFYTILFGFYAHTRVIFFASEAAFNLCNKNSMKMAGRTILSGDGQNDKLIISDAEWHKFNEGEGL